MRVAARAVVAAADVAAEQPAFTYHSGRDVLGTTIPSTQKATRVSRSILQPKFKPKSR